MYAKLTMLLIALVLVGCQTAENTVMIPAPVFPVAARSEAPVVDATKPSYTYSPHIEIHVEANKHIPVSTSATAAQGDEAATGMWATIRTWLAPAAGLAAGAALAQ